MANGRFELGNDNMTKENLKNVLTVVRDIINRSSEIGIRKAQAAEEQAYKAQTTAEASKTTAETAKITADGAKITAEAAQTAADAAQSVLGNISTGGAQIEVSLAFDKQTSGRDSFVFNGFNYYKCSEFSPAPANVVSFSGTSAYGVAFSEIQDGENCRQYGYFIMVEKAGACTLPITSTVSGSFTAQSAGLYASFTSGNDRVTAGTAKFTCTGSYLLAHSSSGKKFIIIVDDSGNISTVEATIM